MLSTNPNSSNEWVAFDRELKRVAEREGEGRESGSGVAILSIALLGLLIGIVIGKFL